MEDGYDNYGGQYQEEDQQNEEQYQDDGEQKDEEYN